MTLYELTDEWQQLLELMEDPDVDDQVIADTLEAIGGEIEAKADGYAMVMAQLKADCEAIKFEETRLSCRRKVFENNIERMKKNLQNAMEMTGKTKFKTTLFSYNVQNNPASVVIDDATKIPAQFLIQQEPKIDKKSIKEFLSENTADFAHLENTKSLRIK